VFLRSMWCEKTGDVIARVYVRIRGRFRLDLPKPILQNHHNRWSVEGKRFTGPLNKLQLRLASVSDLRSLKIPKHISEF